MQQIRRWIRPCHGRDLQAAIVVCASRGTKPLVLHSSIIRHVCIDPPSPHQADRLQDLSSRLRRSERERKAQATELVEARAEAQATRSESARLVVRSKKTADANEAISELRAAQASALAERDGEIARLREKLEIATGELAGEQEGTAALRVQLEATEGDLRHARDRASAAEDGAAAQAARTASAESAGRGISAAVKKQVSDMEALVAEKSAATDRARGEAKAAEAALKEAEEEGHRQAREAAWAREKLQTERDGSARARLELEVGVTWRANVEWSLSIACFCSRV